MNNCPVCMSDDNKVFVEKPTDYEYFMDRDVTASLLVCNGCGSVYQEPWPSAEELDKIYPEDYQNYTRKDVPLLSTLLNYMVNSAVSGFVKAHGADKTILDYGCGDGTFVKALAENGAKHVVGYEPNIRENAVTSGEGFTIQRDLKALGEHGPFDIIRMNHVIEHLADLDATMMALSVLLKKGGVILIQTPNPRSSTLSIFGRYWGALHYPYHTVLISQDGLAGAAARWGLEAQSFSGALMPTGWSMSLENIIKSKTSSTHRGRLPVYSLLALLVAPLAVFEKFFMKRRCSIYDSVLVKR